MPGRIAVVGSNMMDLVTYVHRMPARGETLEAPSFAMGHGGKGANQAVAAARLGSSVVMVSKVGDDGFADATIANFRTNGIDTTHVAKVPGTSSGVAPIFVEPSGENAILIVKGANAHLMPADVDAAADALKRCSLILLQMEVPVETVYHTIEWGRANGVETLLNPAPAVSSLDAERLRDATFLMPNETELAILTGKPVGNIDEIAAAAGDLIESGIRTVVVTMGARGALLVEGVRRPAHRARCRRTRRYDRRRRCLHRRLRPFLRRRLRCGTSPDQGGEIRRRFGHAARNPDILRDGEGVCRLLTAGGAGLPASPRR